MWSRGDVRLLKAIMAEEHRQLDVVWQPGARAQGPLLLLMSLC